MKKRKSVWEEKAGGKEAGKRRDHRLATLWAKFEASVLPLRGAAKLGCGVTCLVVASSY